MSKVSRTMAKQTLCFSLTMDPGQMFTITPELPLTAPGSAGKAKTQSAQNDGNYLVSGYSHPKMDKPLGPERLVLNAISAGEIQGKRRSGGHSHIT